MKKLLLTVVLGLCTLAGFSQAKFDVHAGKFPILGCHLLDGCLLAPV